METFWSIRFVIEFYGTKIHGYERNVAFVVNTMKQGN